MLWLFIIIKNGVYLQECFAAFIWGVKNVRGGGGGGVGDGGCLQKFSRLIYCGPGVFIFKVEKVEKMPHKTHLLWLLLEG